MVAATTGCAASAAARRDTAALAAARIAAGCGEAESREHGQQPTAATCCASAGAGTQAGARGYSSCAHRNPARHARCSLSQVLCVKKEKKRTFFCLNFYSNEQESIQSNIFCFASRDGDRQIDK
jgi:hypothetical protein